MDFDTQEHLLVPTDFGADAELAFRRACNLGRSLNARLTLLHVKESPSPNGLSGLDAISYLHAVLYSPPDPKGVTPSMVRSVPKNDPIQDELARLANSDWSQGVVVSTAVRTGDVAEEIVRFALEQRVNLIVMGARDEQESRVPWSECVTVAVLRQAHCPVMLVPRRPKQLRPQPCYA